MDNPPRRLMPQATPCSHLGILDYERHGILRQCADPHAAIDWIEVKHVVKVHEIIADTFMWVPGQPTLRQCVRNGYTVNCDRTRNLERKEVFRSVLVQGHFSAVSIIRLASAHDLGFCQTASAVPTAEPSNDVRLNNVSLIANGRRSRAIQPDQPGWPHHRCEPVAHSSATNVSGT